MSKVSFRARALDATKAMAIFKADEIPDLPDFATINRSVPQMPTGMEKEEETEHHLQRALSAQQVYGTSEALVIPIPESDDIADRYGNLYRDEFKQTKQFIHIQAFGMEQEIPDYDMDSEDELWVNEQAKKMEITPLKFEEMMDRLEKGSGQQVVTLQEAKLLLKEDDDLIIAAYDYWLNKRLRLEHPLILQVKTEKRDGSTTNNPYVAFRRRTEKMQTRKNRKNDEYSYEKMLKLRRDLNRAVTILELIKRREKTKKEMLQLTIEVLEKRYQIEDFSGTMLQEAEALRHKMPSTFIPQYAYGSSGWGQTEEVVVRKKREYRKRKHKPVLQHRENTTVQPTRHFTDIDVLHTDVYSSEDEGLSPGMSPSDHEDENDPDGPFAFKRRKNCNYFAPILNRLGNWSWHSPEDGGLGERKYRYNLMSFSRPPRTQGFCRRRMGRGGRILVDRAFTPWDDELSRTDLSSGSGPFSGIVGDYVTYIRERKIPHFRPHSPTLDDMTSHGSNVTSAEEETEFNLESFQSHREQLLQMQRAQEEQLRKQDTLVLDSSCSSELDHSFSSQPTSRFTLDSESAKFAVSAVLNTSQLQSATKTGASTQSSSLTPSSSVSSTISIKAIKPTSCVAVVTTPLPTVAISAVSPAVTLSSPLASVIPTKTLSNGPISAQNKITGLSTSPAATVLQLNFPLNKNNNSSLPPLTTTKSLSSSLTSSSSSSSSAFTPINSISNKTVSAVSSNLLKNFSKAAPLDSMKQNHDDVSHLNNMNNMNSIKHDMAMDVT
ncbi:enhancer of polycomb homolog 1-like [Ylistrum balloti]|uniref:enhancer of polycomb homolog 1-like n=1 Tax=Ylistrum balloti TaxID=509963 RepID=UPI002905BB9E|nr:enhancer of polycomb homolog 1-like [Ylistrum balloti]